MKAVLFDMDGVLVDVSLSYRLTVQRVVEHFLAESIRMEKIQEFKNRGHLNNDWDLTECILNEYGLKVKRRELIDIFQKFYLGNNFNGFIKNEKWLLSVDRLKQIRGLFKTGIVTGRPKMEALYVLSRFEVEEYFSVMITMDDLPTDRGKPDPMGINMALKELACNEAFYIGDSVDDMVAACEANIVPVGIFNGIGDREKQKELLLKYGAVFFLKDINDIMEVLNEKNNRC